MVLDKRVAGIQHVRAALYMPLVPLQYMVSWPVQLIDKLGNTISTHDALVKENLALQSDLLLLKSQVQRLLAIESENNQLKALMRSSTQVQGKVLIAELLAVDSDPFIHQIILNKGNKDGVFIGQPVLDATGVTGQVIQVGPLSSRVLLINDTHSGIPVQNARNGLRAIALGDSYSGLLHLANVPQTTDIKVGDVLITSGLGMRYPEGYPVGEVISIIRDPGLQFASIIVQPKAHLDRSREVLLVWPNQKPVSIKVEAAKEVLNPPIKRSA